MTSGATWTNCATATARRRPPCSNLAEYARIRLAADRIGLESLDREGSTVVLKFRQDAKLDPTWLLRLVQSRADLTLLPPAVLRMDLERPVTPPDAPARRPPSRPTPLGRLRPKRDPAPELVSDSWWTSRATADEVTLGFTRETVTAEAALDPAAPGGLFERLGKVLGHLSQGLLTG